MAPGGTKRLFGPPPVEGRYWSNNRHWSSRILNGSVTNDPKATRGLVLGHLAFDLSRAKPVRHVPPPTFHLHYFPPKCPHLRILGVVMKIRMIITAICALFALNGVAQCAEITVLAPGAMKEIVTELLPTFQKASGHKVALTWSGTAKIKQKIAGGETYDLVIVGAPVIDAFIHDGKVKTGTVRSLGAVRQGCCRQERQSQARHKLCSCAQEDAARCQICCLFDRAEWRLCVEAVR